VEPRHLQDVAHAVPVQACATHIHPRQSMASMINEKKRVKD
jgi:predicted nucleotidyltransferase